MPLNYENVANIIKLIDSSSLTSFEVDIDGMRLVVSKENKEVKSQSPIARSIEDSEEEAPAGPTKNLIKENLDDSFSDDEHTSIGTTTTKSDGSIEIRAPMMGTFFRAPSPDDPPYVEIGKSLKKGDALCLIEVMKLFTTLKSEQDGVVKEIPPENGTLVNQGDILFIIGLK